MRIYHKTSLVIILALIGFLFVLPIITSHTAILHIIIWIFVYSILCGTFRFATMTGDWSFAHVSIMAVGAYTSMLLTMKLGWTVWLSMMFAGIVSLIVAFFVYSLCLKTRAVTFFWVTWAFGEIIRQIFARFENPFGGHAGVPGIPGPTIHITDQININFETQLSYYYLGLILLIIVYYILHIIEKSRYGIIFKSVDENLELSESLGINIFKYRLLALLIASFLVGVNGSFYAHWIHFLCPADFGIAFGLMVLLYVVVGGSKTIWGPVMGVTVFVLLDRVILNRLEEYLMAGYGLILMLTLAFFREGLEKIPEKIITKTKKLSFIKKS